MVEFDSYFYGPQKFNARAVLLTFWDNLNFCKHVHFIQTFTKKFEMHTPL